MLHVRLFWRNRSRDISSRPCTRRRGDTTTSSTPVVTVWAAVGLAGRGARATLRAQAAAPPGGGDFSSLLGRRWPVSRRDARARRGTGSGRSVSDFFLENASSEMSARRRLPPAPTPSLGQESSPGTARRRRGEPGCPRARRHAIFGLI